MKVVTFEIKYVITCILRLYFLCYVLYIWYLSSKCTAVQVYMTIVTYVYELLNTC